MALLYSYDFVKADGDPGDGWPAGSTIYRILTNRLQLRGTSVFNRINSSSAGVPDMVIEATIHNTTTFGSNRTLSLLGRVNAAGTEYYEARFTLDSSLWSAVTLRRVTVAGGTTIFTTRYIPSVTSGDHVFQLSVIGERVTASFDGVEHLTMDEGTITAGNYFGMACAGNDVVFLSLYQVFDAPRQAMAASPSVILTGVEGQLVGLYGYGSLWDAGTPGEPEFTASAGTITAQTVYTSQSAGITITGPDYEGPIVITDPDTGRTAHIRAQWQLPAQIPGTPYFNLAQWLQELSDNLTATLNAAALALFDGEEPGEGESVLGWVRFIGNPTPYGTLAALNTDILDHLANDHDDPTTLRSVVVDILAQLYAIDGTPTPVTLPQLLTAIQDIEVPVPEGIAEALEAIAIQLTNAQTSLNLISTNDSVTIADARNDIGLVAVDVGATLIKVDNVQADINAIRTGSDYTLGTVGNWLLGIGSLQAVTLAAVLASVLGRGTATALQVVDVVTDVVAAGTDLEDIVTVILTWLGNMAQPTLPTISVDLTTAINAINGVHDDLGLDLTAILEAISGHDLDIKSQLDGIQGQLDQVLSGLAGAGGGAPSWPGLANVTLRDPVPISGTMTLTGPIDGALYAITGTPPKLGKAVLGAHTSYYNMGQAAFVSDNDDVEAFQTVNWDRGVLLPRVVLTPASLVLHFTAGVSGTVTPWVRNVP